MMKLNKKLGSLVATGLLAGLIGCGGSGDEDTPTEPPVISVSAGVTAMADADYTQAKQSFCGVLEDNEDNSKAAFGCALMKLIEMAESSQMTDLYNIFEFVTPNMQLTFFDPEGYFDLISRDTFETYESPEIRALNIPLVNLVIADEVDREGEGRYVYVLKSLINSMVNTNSTLAHVQDEVVDLSENLEEIQDLLQVAINDGSFTFTIPGTFIYRTDEQLILPADVRVFDLGVRSLLFTLEMADQYDVSGGDVSRILRADNSINVQELTEQLNGSLGARFGTLKSGANFGNSLAIFSELVSRGVTTIDALRTADSTDLFANLVADYDGSLTDSRTLLTELQTSVSAGMTPLSYTDGNIEVDLREFFTNPPNASDLPASAGDPFDYSPAGSPSPFSGETISFVGSFLESYFDAYANW